MNRWLRLGAALLVGLACVYGPPAAATALGQFRFWTEWMYVGEATISGSTDSLRVAAKPYERTFSDLQIRVRKHAVQFRRVRIHFADETSQEVSFEYRIPARGTSRTIDLEDGSRSVRAVEFWYDPLPPGEDALIQIYARG